MFQNYSIIVLFYKIQVISFLTNKFVKNTNLEYDSYHNLNKTRYITNAKNAIKIHYKLIIVLSKISSTICNEISC